jgi:methionine aminopeptidase
MRESLDSIENIRNGASEIKEGVTLYLDKLAQKFRDHGAEPSFLGLYGFPNSLCIDQMHKSCTEFPI